MGALSSAFAILASVIVVGGLAKVAAPSSFAALLGTLGLPASTTLARLSGVVEVALGSTAVIVGGRAAAIVVTVAYGVFTATVVAARRSGATSCGCFGSVAAPPSTVHVVVNATSATIAALAAIAGPTPLFDTLGAQPMAGVPYLVALATATWLMVVVDTTGAQLVDGIRSVAAMGPTYRANVARVGHDHGSPSPPRGRT